MGAQSRYSLHPRELYHPCLLFMDTHENLSSAHNASSHKGTPCPSPSASGGPSSVCLSPFPWPLGEHRGSLCLPPAVAKGTQNNPVHCLFVSPKAFESQRKREMRKQLKAPSECCTNIFPAQGACEQGQSL